MPTPGGCGRKDCRCSSGIDEILTFGRGRLNDLGFWEEACAPCARASERSAGVAEGAYWPHTRAWLAANGYKFTEEDDNNGETKCDARA